MNSLDLGIILLYFLKYSKPYISHVTENLIVNVGVFLYNGSITKRGLGICQDPAGVYFMWKGGRYRCGQIQLQKIM